MYRPINRPNLTLWVLYCRPELALSPEKWKQRQWRIGIRGWARHLDSLSVVLRFICCPPEEKGEEKNTRHPTKRQTINCSPSDLTLSAKSSGHSPQLVNYNSAASPHWWSSFDLLHSDLSYCPSVINQWLSTRVGSASESSLLQHLEITCLSGGRASGRRPSIALLWVVLSPDWE